MSEGQSVLGHLERVAPTGGRGCRTEERERAAAEIAAARLTMAAAGAEVEATAATDATRAAVAELEALRASSTGSSVSADGDRDNELKLVKEAA
jgi:hypothetical protein